MLYSLVSRLRTLAQSSIRLENTMERKFQGAKVPGSVSLPGANGLGSGNSSSQFLCGLYFDIDIERVPIVRIQTEFLTVFRT